MSKKQAYLILLFTVVLSLAANILFGRLITAKVSTLPFLNRWKILSPQAPIVINTREEVRVNDAADVQQAADNVRSKLSLVLSNANGQMTVLGGALNLTSDGFVLTTKSVVDSQKPQNLFVKLDDGELGQVSSTTLDSATGAVILKTTLNNISVANLGSSGDLAAGQRLIFVQPTVANYSFQFSAGFVSQTQKSDESAKYADVPSRGFGAQGVGGGLPGQIIADTSGNILGLWDGTNIISSDVLQNISSNFLGNQDAIVRPEFGFRYRVIGAVEAKLLGTVQGDKVTGLDAGGPAQKAGLLENDIIQKWDGTDLNEGVLLEELLQNYKPGDKVGLTVLRGKNQLTLMLVVGQSK